MLPRPRLALGALVVLLGMSSIVAAAAPLHPLAARLETKDALELRGMLSVAAGPDPAFAVARFAEDAPASSAPLMRTAHAELELQRWEGEYVDLGPLPAKPKWLSAFYVSDATLTITGLLDRPQLLAREGVDPPTSFALNATAPRCEVWNPGARLDERFPDDPRSLSTPVAVQQGADQLAAKCSADAWTAETPHETYLYGMDLWLASAERSEAIRTGTFEEPGLAGDLGARTVTQILVVRFLDDAIRLDAPPTQELRIFADEFLAVGALRFPTADGFLTWGSFVRDGTVDGFEATGEYRLASSPGGAVGARGTTLDAPPPARVDGVQPHRKLAPRMAIAVAGTLAVLALAAGLRWALFARIPQERLLQHPTRARIFECVKTRPGVSKGEVRRTLGLRWVNLAHHLGPLERAGLVVARRVAGRTALFPVGAGFAGRFEPIALLQRPGLVRTFEALRREPGLDQSALAVRLGVTRQAAGWAVRRLLAARLVRAERAGHRFQYVAQDLPSPQVPGPGAAN